MCDEYVIGYWMTERKRQKFNWDDFQSVCNLEGFSLKMASDYSHEEMHYTIARVCDAYAPPIIWLYRLHEFQIDIGSCLDSQGPFHVFVHKLTDTLAHADGGDHDARAIITRVQSYISKHPELIVIDPLDNIRNLRNRHKSYEIIQNGIQIDDVFTPNFVEIKSKNACENVSLLKKKGIRFPFVCKPLVAHGSSDAHKMMIIFNERGLNDCQPPCVAQDFINHNAILYKVFIVGDHYHVVERPSMKNFYEEDCMLLNTIFFNSHDISKVGSKSIWSILSEDDVPVIIKPNYDTLEKIVKKITKIFGLLLVGVDVVIENHTRKYAIIDVNVFPGYDGYPNFFHHLLDSIRKLLIQNRVCRQISNDCSIKKCGRDNLDFGIKGDERKKYSTK